MSFTKITHTFIPTENAGTKLAAFENMKSKEKGLAILGTAVFAALAALIGNFIRKL